VEEALSAANDGDMEPLQALLAVIASPYADLEHPAKYMEAPDPAFDQTYKTFCGT